MLYPPFKLHVLRRVSRLAFSSPNFASLALFEVAWIFSLAEFVIIGSMISVREWFIRKQYFDVQKVKKFSTRFLPHKNGDKLIHKWSFLSVFSLNRKTLQKE